MKGYINLKLGGKNRGIKFGNHALLSLISKGIIGEQVEFSYSLIGDLVYAGLVNNCFIKKEDVEFTKDDVLIWIDDAEFASLMEVFQVFQSSYVVETKAKTTKK